MVRVDTSANNKAVFDRLNALLKSKRPIMKINRPSTISATFKGNKPEVERSRGFKVGADYFTPEAKAKRAEQAKIRQMKEDGSDRYGFRPF
jgi:hypothetical protein